MIRKNSVLADKSGGTLEESLKQSASIDLKNRIGDLEGQNAFLQEERAQVETNLRTLEHKFSQILKEN